MKCEHILNSIDYIEPGIIEEAENYTVEKKTIAWVRYVAIAVCLCLCFAGIKLYPEFQESKGSVETGNGIEDHSAPVHEGANAGIAMTENSSETDSDVKIMIGHYDESLNESDMAVSNGYYELSNSLKAAINEYGDTVSYRVVVEVFKDGVVIDSGGVEVASEESRLSDENYIVAHETLYKDKVKTGEYFTIHAEKNQLLSFPTNSSYGYYITLYDEYPDLAKPADDSGSIYNGAAQPANMRLDDMTDE